MKKISFAIICVCTLFSCQSNEQSEVLDSSEDTLIVEEEMDTVDVDSLLSVMYVEVDTFYSDSLGMMTIPFNPAGYEKCSDLTGDGIEEYFVVLDYMGGPTHGIIHDGITGEQIPLYPNHLWIMSRPGVDIEYRVVDVNCGDGFNEIAVMTGGGGTIGNYYYCELFRYNQDSSRMELAFGMDVNSTSWDIDTDEERYHAVNYIDFLYLQDSCFNQIKVVDGKESSEWGYSLDVDPIPGQNERLYIFDAGKNEFVLKE